MKYKIIDENVVKNIIEFLDDIQFTTAEKGDTPQHLEIINMCSYIISELLNSEELIDNSIEPDELHDEDDRMVEFEFGDMPDEEFDKLINQFDSFFKNFKKEYHKSNVEKKLKGKSGKSKLKSFRDELKKDGDLSPEEKFELYYDEYIRNKQKQNSIELNEMLDQIGLSYFK